MTALLFALLTILGTAAVNLTLLEATERAGVGLIGVCSRMVTLPLLAAWILTRGDGWRRLRPRGTGWLLLWMGLISIGINLLWFTSLKWTTATNVTMIYRLDLVFVVMIGAGLGLERLGRAQLVLLPVLLVGFALFTQIDNFDLGGHLIGDLMIVTAAFGFAVNAFVIRRILRTLDEETVALYNHGISALGFVALALSTGELAECPRLFREADLSALVVVLGFLVAVSLPLYYAALSRMDVWKLRAMLLFAPVLTAAIEWPIWGARLTFVQCLGAAIILTGLAILIRMESRPGGAFATTSEAASHPLSSEDYSSRRPTECPRDERKEEIA